MVFAKAGFIGYIHQGIHNIHTFNKFLLGEATLQYDGLITANILFTYYFPKDSFIIPIGTISRTFMKHNYFDEYDQLVGEYVNIMGNSIEAYDEPICTIAKKNMRLLKPNKQYNGFIVKIDDKFSVLVLPDTHKMHRKLVQTI
jgi:hypothetical protein